MKRYEIEEYVAADGSVPFREWLLGLKDETMRGKWLARIDRAAYGNFGDWKPIKGAVGLYEMRERHGQASRVYYTKVGTKMVLLLAGSLKKDQKKGIAEAKKYLAEYKRLDRGRSL